MADKKQKPLLPEGTNVPVHIGVIMDGNGRWAKKRGLPRKLGHREGAQTFRTITRHAKKLGVKYFTVYAFSTENWRRPADEVEALMDLFEKYLDRGEHKSALYRRPLDAKTCFAGENEER